MPDIPGHNAAATGLAGDMTTGAGPRFSPADMYGRAEGAERATVKLGVGVFVRDGQGRVLLERRSD